MEDIPHHQTLPLITTHLKLIVKTQRLLLKEQQKQTEIAADIRNHLLAGSTSPLSDKAADSKKRKQPPLVINATEVAGILTLTKRYSEAKVRKMCEQYKVPQGAALPIRIFCKATGLAYDDVIRRMGY
jgi:hypothetical protein